MSRVYLVFVSYPKAVLLSLVRTLGAVLLLSGHPFENEGLTEFKNIVNIFFLPFKIVFKTFCQHRYLVLDACQANMAQTFVVGFCLGR